MRAHADAILDRLRERYAAVVDEGGDFTPYAAARGLHDLRPDPDWLPRFMTPPPEAMRVRVGEWLSEHGADNDLDQPGTLPPVDLLRERNASAIDTLVKVLLPLVEAWCRKQSVEPPSGWHGAVLLESKSCIDKSGLSDLVALSEGQLIDAVEHAVKWPDGMPRTADLVQLGLTPNDLARTAKGLSHGSGGTSSIVPRTITIGDAEVSMGRGQLSAIADIAARTVGESFLAQSGRGRLDAVQGVPRPRLGTSSPKQRIVVAKMNQTNEDQRSGHRPGRRSSGSRMAPASVRGRALEVRICRRRQRRPRRVRLSGVRLRGEVA
ncbi:hypothetical protein [Streptomyces prasinus]|uniref:hypothetical protein n=1 Tax=Streptomyces prasinus TaxID=67345 RepID=UPI0033BD189C